MILLQLFAIIPRIVIVNSRGIITNIGDIIAIIHDNIPQFRDIHDKEWYGQEKGLLTTYSSIYYMVSHKVETIICRGGLQNRAPLWVVGGDEISHHNDGGGAKLLLRIIILSNIFVILSKHFTILSQLFTIIMANVCDNNPE